MSILNEKTLKEISTDPEQLSIDIPDFASLVEHMGFSFFEGIARQSGAENSFVLPVLSKIKALIRTAQEQEKELSHALYLGLEVTVKPDIFEVLPNGTGQVETETHSFNIPRISAEFTSAAAGFMCFKSYDAAKDFIEAVDPQGSAIAPLASHRCLDAWKIGALYEVENMHVTRPKTSNTWPVDLSKNTEPDHSPDDS